MLATTTKQSRIQTMIKKPTLLLDQNKCKQNIELMFLKAKKHHVSFRPHFKTHQSLQIGQWFKDFGVNKITVSSLEMAEYFSSQWDDITVAFPVNILEVETINQLTEKIALNVLVESVETTLFLKKHSKNKLGVFLKIDVGYNRTGLPFSATSIIDDILEIISTSKTLDFKGFLAHAGQTYNSRTKEEIINIHNTSRRIMLDLKANYINDFPNLIISLGDTPSCSIADDFSGIDEMRPGNFVFYDLTQNQIGSNTINQIAVAMACPIVSIHEKRNEIVVYGGGVHFSKDSLEDKTYGIIYGKVVEQTNDGWGKPIPGMYIKSLSQEHGIISVPKAQIKNYAIGDILIVLPIHSCMTADSMKQYKNNMEIIDRL